jgi:hypothetical protein
MCALESALVAPNAEIGNLFQDPALLDEDVVLHWRICRTDIDLDNEGWQNSDGCGEWKLEQLYHFVGLVFDKEAKPALVHINAYGEGEWGVEFKVQVGELVVEVKHSCF